MRELTRLGFRMLAVGVACVVGFGCFVAGLWFYLLFLSPEARHEALFGSDGPHSGWDATWMGDANGDGAADLLLSTPFEPDPSGGHGIARLISGRDGSILRSFSAQRWIRIVPAGDVDADGCVDLLFPARVVSGRTGREIMRFENSQQRSYAAGDIDGDGHADVLVTDPFADGEGKKRGLVWILSGTDGSRIRTHEGVQDGDGLGLEACGLGHVDGDQMDDYALSTAFDLLAPGGVPALVRIYSGRTGEMLHEIRDPGFDGFMPMTLAGDVDGDGASDLLVGTNGSSMLILISGGSGSVLFRRDEDGVWRSGSAGDVDGDGTPDLQIQGYSSRSRVESGLTGHWLVRLEDSESGRSQMFGSGIADLDRDGHADLLRLTNRSVLTHRKTPDEVWEEIWHEGLLEVVSGRDGSVLMRIDESRLLGSR